jgi:hypothetical protein
MFPYQRCFSIIFTIVVTSGIDNSGLYYELRYEKYSDGGRGMATYRFIDGDWKC